jgi:hypothetical protein
MERRRLTDRSAGIPSRRARRWLHAVALALVAALVVGTGTADPAWAQAIVWSRSVHGESTRGNGQATHAVADAAGNAYVAAAVFNGENTDLAVAKYAPGGARLWARSLDFGDSESPAGIVIDAAGDVVVAATSSERWVAVVKYAPNGDLLGSTKFTPSPAVRPYLVVMAASPLGGVVIAGSLDPMFVARLDSTLAVTWTRSFSADPGQNVYVRGLVVDGTGSAVVVGEHFGANPGGALVLKVSASGDLQWLAGYPGGAATAVAADGAGNVFVAGHVGEFTPQYDLLALKYAGDGTLLWANTLDVQSGSVDESRSIALDGSGNVVIAGTRYRTPDDDAVLWKLASNGQSLWSRVVGFEPGSQESVAGLGIDALGNVTVAGTTGAPASLPQWFWSSFAADGTALSAVRLPNGGSSDGMAAMTLAGGSRGVAAGRRWNETDDVLVASFVAPGGALQWSATGSSIGTETAVRWGPSSSELTGQGLAVGADGQVTFAGAAYDGVRWGVLAARWTADGTPLWRAASTIPAASSFTEGMALGPTGAAHLGGTVVPPWGAGSAHALSLRVEANGATGWRLDPATPEGYSAIAVDSAGRSYLAGSTQSPNEARLDCYGANGALLWSRSHAVEGFYLFFRHVALDGAGNVYAAGVTYSSGGTLLLVKYSPDGTLLWSRAHAAMDSGANALAVDAAGNATVTGTGAFPALAVTARYASDGTLLWADQFGAGSGNREGIALAVDASGAAYVALRGGTTPALVKYTATGSHAWVHPLVRAGYWLRPTALALDAHGNPLVLMRAQPETGWHSTLVTKLGRSTGAVLWETLHATPGSPGDDPIAIATTPGAAYVAVRATEAPHAPGVIVLRVDDPLDLTPPETSITSAPADPSATSTATFTFTANESEVSFECRLDGAAFAPCTSPRVYSGLALGAHGFAVRARDSSDNVDPTPATHAWSVTRYDTVTQIVTSQPYAPVGTPILLTATVAGWTPTGSVAFLANPGVLPGCAAVPLAGTGATRTATCTVTSLPVGTYALSAVYAGDADDNPSIGSTSQSVLANAPPACGGFADIDSASTFCLNVEWAANRAITLGCGAGSYCPAVVTSRLAMAAFMNRLAVSLQPAVAVVEAAATNLDPTAEPVVCQGADIPVTGYPRRALVDAVISARAAVASAIVLTPVASFDQGTTWAPLAANPQAITLPPGAPVNARAVGSRDLDVGQTVRFGLQIARGALPGGASPADVRCRLRTSVGSRESWYSPLDSVRAR